MDLMSQPRRRVGYSMIKMRGRRAQFFESMVVFISCFIQHVDIIIHNMTAYDNFHSKIVFDQKNQAIIDYTVGVRQGDNMAGLLFLFLMQAMDESFKKQCALPEPEFRTHRDSKRGRLLKQPAPAKTKGVPFHFGKSMFADDTMYILSSRPGLETLCAAIFHHMRRFGLLMHAGTLDENGNHIK